MIARLYRRLLQRWHGIPIMVITYKPWRKGKNCCVSGYGIFMCDEYVSTRLDEIAQHIREKYQADMNKIVGGIE